ncbi:uncharacterized protein si:ch211-191i18.2 [Cyprinodon tularosa]|uniref:uncharacterized protein si:ch211-191i18.2 n=1 Tax=Cyprinodon tularosa TaxID=77115 RepID=UPI0018E1EF39|nr:uncharacterized protein si:ch211-191i18.2 [Cyprinodon tularosa]
MMSSLRLLTVHLLGASLLLLLLLTAVCEAQYYSDVTPTPEDDFDYNSTIQVSFFSNSSIEDLERFFGKVTGTEDEENEEEEVNVSTVSSKWDPTESSKDSIDNGASFPVSLEFRKLLWTSFILMVLNSQQL